VSEADGRLTKAQLDQLARLHLTEWRRGNDIYWRGGFEPSGQSELKVKEGGKPLKGKIL
jgi:hypothetical protein